MKTFILLTSMMLASLAIVAQGVVQGRVYDADHSPLIGASVTIEGTRLGTTTDVNGNFRILSVAKGVQQIKASFVGYAPQTMTADVQDGDNARLTFELSVADFQLADVTITGGIDRPVNTLSQVDINLRPVNTSQDILRMVPGLFIAQHAGGGKAEQIFIRGFDADHGTDVNVEVDGMPVNMVSHAHGQGYADLHFLIPELVSDVDFDKGPYFANKGDFTTGGFVEFRTRNTLDRNFVKLEGGSFGMARAVAGVNLFKGDRSSAYIASEFSRTDGFFEHSQHFHRLNVQARFNTRLSERTQLTASASAFDSEWDASGQIPDRAIAQGLITRLGSIDPTEGGGTSRYNFFIRTDHFLGNGATLQNQAYAFNYNFSLYSNFTFFLNDPVDGDQIHQQEGRWVYGYKAQYNHTSALGGKKLVTEAGAGFRYDVINDIALSHTIRRAFLNDFKRGDIREGNANAYWSETLSLTEKFSVNAALRLDYFHFSYTDRLTAAQPADQGKAIVSPKLNLNYQASEKVNLFVRAGSGFHSNDARVVVAQTTTETLPKAYGIDVGTEMKITPALFLHVALWRLDLDQEFVYVGDEAVVEASGKTKREGVDLSVRYQLTSWLFADADLNLARPRAKGVPDGEHFIPLAPTVTSIGGFSVRKREGLNGSLRYRYLGDRAANEDKTVIATGYFIADAIINYTKPGFELGVTVENIFDTQWKEAQFDTETRLKNEAAPVSEIHFTPGTPFAFKFRFTKFF